MKFYTLPTHSLVRKPGKFHYIIYRIDKITLLFIMLSQLFKAVENTFSVNREKYSEYLPSPFPYSCQTTSKTRDSVVSRTCGKLSNIISSATQKLLFWASDEDDKIASCVAPQRWHLHGIQIRSVIRRPLFNHLRTLLALLRDTRTRAVREEPDASCCVCRSVCHGSSRLHSSMNFGIRN